MTVISKDTLRMIVEIINANKDAALCEEYPDLNDLRACLEGEGLIRCLSDDCCELYDAWRER